MTTTNHWPEEKAWNWYRQVPWLRGFNYIPSTSINTTEMWQAETFDPATIDRELGLAESLGFNSVRVFLHDLPYKDDALIYGIHEVPVTWEDPA